MASKRKRKTGAGRKPPGSSTPRHGAKASPGQAAGYIAETTSQGDAAVAMQAMGIPDETPVILASGDAEPPAGSAGELLGTLNKSLRLGDGTVLPPGTRVYRGLRPLTRAEMGSEPRDTTITAGDLAGLARVSEPPLIPPEMSPGANQGILAAARDREGPGPFSVPETLLPDEVRRRLEAAHPGLAGRLASGLSADELDRMAPQIARAMEEAGAGPGTYMFREPGGGKPGFAAVGHARPEILVTDDLGAVPDDGEPTLVIEDLDPDDDDAGRLLIGSPDNLRRWHARERELDRQAAPLVPGPDESGLIRDAVIAEGRLGGLQSAWKADAVLDTHAWLTKNYRQPGDDLADYLARLIRSFIGQGGTPMMFWPVEVRRGDPAGRDEGCQLAKLLARGLGEAGTYQVTAPMCRRMTETWDAARPAFREVLPLDEGELPAPAGFAWLDLPWLIREDAGYWLPVRAVSWETTTVLMEGRVTGGAPVTADAARIALWVLSADDVAFGRWEPDHARAERAAVRVGRLTPVHVMVMPFGTRMPVNRGHTTLLGAFGLLHILWMYLGMELPRSRPVTAAAPAVRQRAAKSLKHDEVHVITLRRIAYISDGPPGHRMVNRTCKWWVDDFHRHIDPYRDEDSDGRPRRHEAVPAGRAGYVGDDDHDICGVCLARGQTVRIALVHGHRRGPAWLPWKTPAKDRTLLRLAR